MNLKEYMQRVYMLEKSRYEQHMLVEKLQQRLENAKRPQYYAKVKAKKESFFFNVFVLLFITVITTVLGAIVGSVLALIIEFVGTILFEFDEQMVEKICVIIALLCGLAGAVIGVSLAISGIKDDHRKYKKAKAHNQNVEIQNQIIQNNAPKIISSIKGQVEKARSNLAVTEAVLRSYYEKNIIFPKYRGLVPVAMFYEYLASGRCTQLEGHEGAYNIFEQEVRMNLILTKLDDIIDRLDSIERNQYMLANAVREGNRKADQIYRQISSCADQLQSIDNNSTIAAYYSGISALNTTYMAWIKNKRY